MKTRVFATITTFFLTVIFTGCTPRYTYDEPVPEMTMHSILGYTEAEELIETVPDSLRDAFPFVFNERYGNDYRVIASSSVKEVFAHFNSPAVQEYLGAYLLLTSVTAQDQSEQYVYFADSSVALSGEHVEQVIIEQRHSGYDNEYDGVMVFKLDSEGKELFAQYTSERVGSQVGICFDGKLQAAPNIGSAVPGGEFQISGDFTFSESMWDDFKRGLR